MLYNDLIGRIGLYTTLRTTEVLEKLLPPQTVYSVYLKRLENEAIDRQNCTAESVKQYYWASTCRHERNILGKTVDSFLQVTPTMTVFVVDSVLYVHDTHHKEKYQHQYKILLLASRDEQLFFVDDALNIYTYIYGTNSVLIIGILTTEQFSMRQFVYRGDRIALRSD